MTKLNYIKPVAEEFARLLATDILDASIEGELEGYGESEDFTW